MRRDTIAYTIAKLKSEIKRLKKANKELKGEVRCVYCRFKRNLRTSF